MASEGSALTVEESRELIGPFFVGAIVNYLLWGVQLSQTYYYYKVYRNTDRALFKTAVALLFIVELAQSICVTQGVWHFVVEGWGTNPVITPLSGGFLMVTILDAVTASIVHVIYAQKILSLFNSPYDYIFTGIVLLLSCCQLAGGIGCVALAFAIDVTLVSFYRIKVWSCVWLVTASATDIIICVLLTWRLSKSRTGFKETDDLISKLIRTTVETGVAPAVVQILDLVVFLIWPAKSYHVTLTLLNPKVYSNSMMALLNSRMGHKREPAKTWTSSSGQGHAESYQFRSPQPIRITTESEYQLESNFKSQLPPMGPK